MAQADSDNSTFTPAPEKPQDSLYLPTDTTPEQIFRAIGKLRKDVRHEIDRLIRFLDETENHMELEGSIDDNPHDDEGEAEPSLGSF
jgi:hypothetical protein